VLPPELAQGAPVAGELPQALAERPQEAGAAVWPGARWGAAVERQPALAVQAVARARGAAALQPALRVQAL
jgi:hypothetical protein